MKRILLLLTAVFAALPLMALDKEAVIRDIEEAGLRRGVNAQHFYERRTSPTGETTRLEGELEFDVAGSLSMLYDNGEKFVISKDKMTVVRDGKEAEYDLKKNILRRQLAHTVIYTIGGQISAFCKEQKLSVDVAEEGKFYRVTFVNLKKAPQGYSRVVVWYRCRDGKFDRMQMEEVTGLVTFYSYSPIK